jgi:DNA modification methylase
MAGRSGLDGPLVTLVADADGPAEPAIQLEVVTDGEALASDAAESVVLRAAAAPAAQPALEGVDEPAAHFGQILYGDARALPLTDASVDLVVTSPPYWNKRDYGPPGQIGQERTPEAYADAILECLREWRRVLRPTGSVFLNVGDSFYRKSLAGVPALLEVAAIRDGWRVRNRIIWTKTRGMPEPAQNRLAGRHEYVIHLVQGEDYYYDLFGYTEDLARRGLGKTGVNPGDVWQIDPERNMGKHLAPFPEELVRRAVLLGCPRIVCSKCGQPRRRIIERTRQLDPSRPQAKRAMELAEAAGLRDEHIAAIQATGVSDAGKALRTQTGTGRNSAEVRALARHAKQVLGGYFREFTFPQRRSVGWTGCEHGGDDQAGTVLDPFVGTGTTVRAAAALNRNGIGVDLLPHPS